MFAACLCNKYEVAVELRLLDDDCHDNDKYIYIYIYIYNSLRIHEENTKENHNRIVSLYVIKTHVTFKGIYTRICIYIYIYICQSALTRD